MTCKYPAPDGLTLAMSNTHFYSEKEFNDLTDELKIQRFFQINENFLRCNKSSLKMGQSLFQTKVCKCQ